VFTTLLGASTSALADEPLYGSTTPTERASARTAMVRGDAAYDAGRLDDALESYRAADRIMGVPTTAFARGRVEAALGRLVDAQDSLLRVIRHPMLVPEPLAFQAARTAAAALLHAIEPRLPLVELELSPADAAKAAVVKVDGVGVPVVGRSTVLRLDPGAHVVTVDAKGFEGASGTLSVRERQRRRVTATLAPSLALGDVPIATYVSGGFVVGGLLVGGVTGVVSMLDTESLLARCDAGVCPPTLRPRYERALDLARASNVGFAVAGAASAACLLTLATWKDRAHSQLRLDVSTSGVVVSGAF
jgi:hypothetical protein